MGKVAASVLVLLILGLEALARAQGHLPSVDDSKGLWAVWREQVSDGDRSTVALLGASRMQRFDLSAWRARFPGHQTVQLAVAAGSALPTLRHLAEDEDFVGTVICGLTGYQLPRRSWTRQTSWTEFYDEDWNALGRISRNAQTWLQERVVLLDGHGFARRLLPALAEGGFPRPYYLRIHADRSYEADYRLAEIDMDKLERELPAFFEGLGQATDEELVGVVAEVATMVDAIVARGGQVVFLRFPTSGVRRELDEQFFPRARTWDALAAGVPGAHFVHFEDEPELAGFTCPDLSHLDARDAEAFTLGVANVLVERGVIQ